MCIEENWVGRKYKRLFQGSSWHHSQSDSQITNKSLMVLTRLAAGGWGCGRRREEKELIYDFTCSATWCCIPGITLCTVYTNVQMWLRMTPLRNIIILDIQQSFSFYGHEIPHLIELETSRMFKRDCQCTLSWVTLIEVCLFWTLQRQQNHVLKWQTFAWCIRFNMLVWKFRTLQ